MTNPVYQLRIDIESAAKAKNIGVRFTQTNHGSFACTSRVYIFPVNDEPANVNSDSVIESWEFNQSQDAGSSTRCARYRAYADVLAAINEMS